METALIVIDRDAELARARAFVDRLMDSDNADDLARLAAQARLIAAYEEEKWPPRALSAAEVIRYLMDQHGLKLSDIQQVIGSLSPLEGALEFLRELRATMQVIILSDTFEQFARPLLASPRITPNNCSASGGASTAVGSSRIKTSARR